jgi:hypothetical protein
MKRIALLIVALVFAGVVVHAQDEGNELTISGSVDTYFKYDFSGMSMSDGSSNIPTSFANEHNSISIGMIDIGLSQTIGKASFVGEISFGPRGQSQSLLNAAGDYDESFNSFNIQNLYVTYAFSDLFSLTAGYMGTFVGYEVISPAGNFNYSTSYLFTNGPFQNAGLKADFAISDRFGFMVGLFNDWNVYQDFNGISDVGAQVYVAPVDGWDVYVNFLTGKPSGTVIDLTTGFQITDKLYLGLNAADYSAPNDGGGYTGVALYPQVGITEGFEVGLRGEYFSFKDVEEGGVVFEGENVFALTLTGNLKAGPLTLIPELRLDSVSEEVFSNGGGDPSKSASQFVLAAVYAF